VPIECLCVGEKNKDGESTNVANVHEPILAGFDSVCGIQFLSLL